MSMLIRLKTYSQDGSIYDRHDFTIDDLSDIERITGYLEDALKNDFNVTQEDMEYGSIDEL